MGNDSTYNPLGRFTDRADLYARFRPDYPDAALDFVIKRGQLEPGCVIADIGSGTGIASRQLARRGIRVIGIEPNDRMRAYAIAESAPADCPQPEYRTGKAEATGLESGSVDAVICAQSFHWFQPEAALQEFHRILKPGGWVDLLWNERDETNPFTAEYGAALRLAPDTAAIEASRASAGDALLQNPLFISGERVVFQHAQTLTEDAMLGRVFSTSYAPREPKAAEALAASLRDAFHRHERDGHVVMAYDTLVYVAQRL